MKWARMHVSKWRRARDRDLLPPSGPHILLSAEVDCTNGILCRNRVSGHTPVEQEDWDCQPYLHCRTPFVSRPLTSAATPGLRPVLLAFSGGVTAGAAKTPVNLRSSRTNVTEHLHICPTPYSTRPSVTARHCDIDFDSLTCAKLSPTLQR
jgi:hypothetical protein